MPLRKRKVFQNKQHIPNITNGTARRPTASTRTRQKSPVKVIAPANKMISRLSRIKKKISPTLLTHSHARVCAPDRFSYKKSRIGPNEGTYKSFGLSQKEKMHIIGNCQERHSRFVQLKKLANDAIQKNKIFTIYGSCKPVRDALTDRGWVEKLPAQRMNMKNIFSGKTPSQDIRKELETLLLSHFVQKYLPSFVWRTKEYHAQKDSSIDMTKDYSPMVNRLLVDAAWTTKQGLCSTVKRNYWFYIEGVAEVYCPRTYNSYDTSEVDSFRNDFKVTACTSLLKWVLCMIANDRPVFVANGKVSIKVILFAINRCKEYLYRKQNKDIDKTLSNVSSGQWNTFMKNYSRIIAKEDSFKPDKEQQLSLYLSYAKFILKEIHKFRPQLSCEGCHNIWIVKPAHCCRGRGIKLSSRIDEVNDMLNKTKAKYVMQKYIEEPLLVHDTKFDIRQYYLVTSTCPLIIWMYKDCYMKFSTQKYNLKNYHESIHLTNNAVQKKYTHCENRHEELPLSNMWDSDTFKSYLEKNGKETVWDSIIYPGMKRAIRSIMLACQDSLIVCKNSFELYGCDFMLDKEYKPWLIEINSCPDLHPTTPVTAKICPAVIRDIIKVVIDYARDPDSTTGRFECIFRQPHTIPRYAGGELIVRGYNLPSTYFYKGKYDFKEPLYDSTMRNQLDVAAVMKMMKEIYEKETNLYPHESDELLEMPSLGDINSKSQIAITSSRCVTEKISSNIHIGLSEESNLSSNYTPNDNDNETTKSSTNSTNAEKSPESVVPSTSSSDKNCVDLSPIENSLLDLSPSTEKFNPLSHCTETKSQPTKSNSGYHKDGTTQALFNLLIFLNRKEREERERNIYQVNLKEA